MSLLIAKRKMVFGNQYIKQFGVLINTATTERKLQGMSMDYITIVSWFYGAKNWVYVILSRVRKVNGLYLCKPLEFDKCFKESNKLKKYVKELEEIERETLISVNDIPKTSFMPKSESTGGSVLKSRSKRKNNNKRNRTESTHTSKTTLNKKSRTKITYNTNLNNTA